MNMKKLHKQASQYCRALYASFKFLPAKCNTNPQDKLVNLVQYKSAVLEAAFGIKGYILPEDIEEIRQWTLDGCATIVQYIREHLQAKFPVDGSVCPWCVQSISTYLSCDLCGYQRRHGKCSGTNHNTYSDALTVLNKLSKNPEYLLRGIHDIPGLQRGMRKIIFA